MPTLLSEVISTGEGGGVLDKLSFKSLAVTLARGSLTSERLLLKRSNRKSEKASLAFFISSGADLFSELIHEI